METDKKVLFESAAPGKAVLTMAVPMIVSQAITVVYNAADTFFIGRLGDPDQVAAVTVAMPLFFCLTALANLFGVGGSGAVSACLGRGEKARARKIGAFCIYSALALCLLYGTAVFFLRPYLLPLIGADEVTYGYTARYVFWTVCVGAAPTVFNPMIANLIRAEGYSREASFGVAMGGIVNVFLDPIFILVLGMETEGAAIATMISTCLATGYFIVFMIRKRRSLSISLSPRYYSAREGIPGKVLSMGFPNFMISFLATLSNSFLNPLVAGYSNAALAGVGIAKKIDLLAFAIAQGMTQGTLPLVSYNFAAKNYDRMKKIVRTALWYGLAAAGIGLVLLFTCAGPLSHLFLSDPETERYSSAFIRIIAFTCPTTTLVLLMMSVFQASEQRGKSFVVSLLRKGLLDIPLMLILNAAFGLTGIIWAIPLADFLAALTAAALFLPYMKKLKIPPGEGEK